MKLNFNLNRTYLNPKGWMCSCSDWLKQPPTTKSSLRRTAVPKLQHSTCGTAARWRHLPVLGRKYVICVIGKHTYKDIMCKMTVPDFNQ